MSSNGRMDINGAWQTRKGHQHFGSSLVTDALALTLPFTLNDAAPPVLDDDVVNAAYGSCLFSDPSSNNKEYIAIAANSKVFLVNLTDGATTEIDYPGISISSKVSMLQAFNYIFIFRDGETALQWDGDLTGTPAFELVGNGDYTQPLVYSTAENTTISGGVVTGTESGHDIVEND